MSYIAILFLILRTLLFINAHIFMKRNFTLRFLMLFIVASFGFKNVNAQCTPNIACWFTPGTYIFPTTIGVRAQVYITLQQQWATQ